MSARVPSRFSVVTLCMIPILSVMALAHRSQASAPAAGTGLIVGHILELSTRAPVGDAVASLIDAKGRIVDNVRTTDDGSFVFRGVAAGTFSVGAVKAGYEPTGGTQRRAPVSLTEGQKVGDVTLLLRKFSSVSGTVLDEAGDPIVGATVELMTKDDRGWWMSAGLSKPTDDRGVYHVFNLKPGQYLALLPSSAVSLPALGREGSPASKADLTSIGAIGLERGLPTSMEIGGSLVGLTKLVGAPHASASGGLVTYAPTFAPDASDASRAHPFTVGSGANVSGVDFHVAATPATSVSGTVVMEDGTPAADIGLHLVDQDSPLRARDVEVATTLSDARGKFTFPVVPAGNFVVNVVRRPLPATPAAGTTVQVESASGPVPVSGSSSTPAPTPARGETLWASSPTSTMAGNVSDVALTLRRGIAITGHVVFEGDQPAPAGADLSRLMINFNSAYGRNDRYVSARPAADQSFAASGLLPGLYSITAGFANVGGPVLWRLRSATVDGHEVADRFSVSDQDVHDVVLTMALRLPAVAGTVHDDHNRPVERAIVLMFPADKQEWDNVAFRRFKSAVTSGIGAYSIAEVPAGDYFVTAVADDDSAGWRDPAMLAQLASVAQRVTVASDHDATAALAIAKMPSREAAAPSEFVPTRVAHGPFVPETDAAFLQARDAMSPARPGTARLDGIVTIAAAPSRPIRLAAVTLSSVDGAVARTTFSDERGHFSFDGLPAGRFHVAAAKPAFLSMEYGAKRAGAPGTAVTLTDGARQSVALAVVPGGVLTGVVRDVAGRPVVGVNVTALVRDPQTSAFHPAKAAAPSTGRETTDDRGEYRIFGLPAGEFIVGTEGDGAAGLILTADDVALAAREVRGAVSPAAASAARRRPQTHPSTFAPATSDATQATRVVLAAGEERANLDIQVPLVVANTIAGRVLGADGVGRSARLVLLPQGTYVPADTRVDSIGHGTSFGGAVSLTSTPTGEFQMAAIPPGGYTLIARGSATGAAAATSWAMTALTIGEDDVDGLTLSLQPGLEVRGRIVADGALPPGAAQVKVGLDAVASEGLAVSVPPVALDTDGRFLLKGVFPGRYRVRLIGAPAGWIAESALVGGHDALDVPIDVAPSDAAPEIAVRMTDQPSDVGGAFSDSRGGAATDYAIVLFSKDHDAWLPQARRVQAVRPDADGHFALKNLPAGHYWLAALTDVEPNEWNDAAFLASLVPSAIAIDLAPGEHKVQNVRLAGK